MWPPSSLSFVAGSSSPGQKVRYFRSQRRSSVEEYMSRCRCRHYFRYYYRCCSSPNCSATGHLLRLYYHQLPPHCFGEGKAASSDSWAETEGSEASRAAAATAAAPVLEESEAPLGFCCQLVMCRLVRLARRAVGSTRRRCMQQRRREASWRRSGGGSDDLPRHCRRCPWRRRRR